MNKIATHRAPNGFTSSIEAFPSKLRNPLSPSIPRPNLIDLLFDYMSVYTERESIKDKFSFAPWFSNLLVMFQCLRKKIDWNSVGIHTYIYMYMEGERDLIDQIGLI